MKRAIYYLWPSMMDDGVVRYWHDVEPEKEEEEEEEEKPLNKRYYLETVYTR